MISEASNQYHGFKRILFILYRMGCFRQIVRYSLKSRYRIDIDDSVVIHPDAYISNDVRIGPGVTLGARAVLARGAIIEAFSVVNRRVPRGSSVAGTPALIRGFDFNPDYLLSLPQSDSFLGHAALDILLSLFDFDSVLDIGCGKGTHSKVFCQHGKTVTAIDFGTSEYFRQRSEDDNLPELHLGNYMAYDFGKKFDCIWASHVLEHQVDVDRFLRKVHSDLKEDGVLAVTVPPMKPQIVGGHVNNFNMGLLLYRLVLAGFDCSEASGLKYGYNISVIVKKKTIELPPLDFDTGDIDRLATYFPFPVQEGFNGDIEIVNWPWQVAEQEHINEGQ